MSGMLRANWRLIAIIVIVIGAAIASTNTYAAFRQNQAVATQEQSQAFRNSIAVMRDLARLRDVAALYVQSGGQSERAVQDLTTALDFLFVRTAQLQQATRVKEAPTNLALVNAIQAIIDFADATMNSPGDDLEQFERTMLGLLDSASHRLLKYSDWQFRETTAAIADQDALLQDMTEGMIGLSILFAVIATGSVYLLERELRATRQRRKAEQKAEYLAYYDTLTGLPRRDRFRDEAADIIAHNDRSMVILLDVDDFKNVNDNHGHAAGDASLRHVAACLTDMVETHRGIAARLGGDEFAAVIPGPISSMRAASICETLIAKANVPLEHENILINTRLSVGVAFFEGNGSDDAADLSAILKSADVALYRSKEEGKNTYSFFDSHLAAIVARRRELELGIGSALDAGDFFLNYQPQVDLRTGRLLGFEALARWMKNGERISPGEFIPVAEATGQVVEIDIFCLRQATAQAVEWFHAGLEPVKISTNLSALHFRNEQIVDLVEDALIDSGLPPYLLTLEITESAMIEDVGRVIRILEKLRALGVKTALDDFGTGYSSLAYLRMLDVDFIKIDQSFVRNLSENTETQIVVESLVALAQGLKKKLVVEGIETEEQRRIVHDLGCDVGQGYLFGRPLDEPDARVMIPAMDDHIEGGAA